MNGSEYMDAIQKYGIPALAVVVLASIVISKQTKTAGYALAGILVIVAIDYIARRFPTPPPPNTQAAWFDSGTLGDWGGHDRDVKPIIKGSRSYPVYGADGDIALCDNNQIGVVAVCGEDFCAYKKPEIRISTLFSPNGKAYRIYTCGRFVPNTLQK